MNEIWKDIPNLAGLYQSSDMGNIRSLDRVIPNVVLSGDSNNAG